VIFGNSISAYGAIRSLSRHDVPLYLVAPDPGISGRSRYVRDILSVDPSSPDLIPRVNEWVRRKMAGEAVLFVGGSDYYLEALAQGREGLAEGIRATFPDAIAVRKVRDKAETCQIAESIGLAVPGTARIRSRRELESSLAAGLSIQPPYLLKAQDSARLLAECGVKGVVCEAAADVPATYDAHDGFFGDLLIQELIPGGEDRLINVIAVLNADGAPLAVFVNRKVRSVAPFLSCTLMETDWDASAVDQSLRLLKTIRYRGYANVEFKLDPRDRLPKLMEINGRLTLSNSHALRCGLDLPFLMYRDALTGAEPPLRSVSRGYPARILWWYPASDLVGLGHRLRARELRLGRVIRETLGRGYVVEPFRWRDPGPGLYQVWRMVRGAAIGAGRFARRFVAAFGSGGHSEGGRERARREVEDDRGPGKTTDD